MEKNDLIKNFVHQSSLKTCWGFLPLLVVLKHLSDARWADAGADAAVRIPAQHDGLLHGLRQPVADGLGKEEGQEPTDDGGNPENEHRSWTSEQSDEQC